jgi:hypothetical protein
MTHVLKPASEDFGVWLIYDIDDVIIRDDIPLYNLARDSYTDEMVGHMYKIMKQVNLITVTTEVIAKYYQNKFKLPKDKFIIIPNYLPRWWIGDLYQYDRTMKQFKEAKKPKIAFICGSNHYDLADQNGGVDDFTHIVDWIRDNSERYEFHFVGSFPKQLKELKDKKKIFIDPPSDILNYPGSIALRGYNLWIAPLQDNVFNRCKSNIKLIESWALGIPSIVQDCACYSPHTGSVFKTADDLQNQVDRLFSSSEVYGESVRLGKNVVDFGDKNAPFGYWLERNIGVYRKLLSLPQRTMKINLGN